MKKPLEGLNILEIGNHPSSEICALILCEYGATVTQISSYISPTSLNRCMDAPQNRGKRRILLDYTDQKNSSEIENFIKQSHAIITADKSFSLHPLFGVETLRSLYPEITYTLISGYGESGPYADHLFSDAVIQAESGIMSITGEEGNDPNLVGGPIAEYLSGCMGCIGTLMSLLNKQSSGNGRFVDVSAMDTLLFGLENQFSVSLKTGIIPKPIGNNYRLSAPVGVFPCKDGNLLISIATDSQWRTFAEVMERPDWITNPLFLTVQDRINNYLEINKETTNEFMKYNYKELTARLQKGPCPYGRVNDFSDVVSHPQVQYRNSFIDVSYPDGDTYRAAAIPFLMNGILRENKKVQYPESF